MKNIVISLWDQAVSVECPASVSGDIEFLFQHSLNDAVSPERRIVIEQDAEDAFSVLADHEAPVRNITRGDLATFVMEAVVRDVVTDLRSAGAIHAGAVSWNAQAVLIAGPSGSGKSSLTSWLANRGFQYLTDEVALLVDDRKIVGFPRSIVLKPGSAERVAEFSSFRGARSVAAGTHTLIHPNGAGPAPQFPLPCGLIVFPEFVSGSDLLAQSLTPAQTAMRLIGCNLNARNLPDGGFRALSDLARSTPALTLKYGAFEQLEDVLDAFVRLLLESRLDVAARRRLLAIFPKFGMPRDIPSG